MDSNAANWKNSIEVFNTGITLTADGQEYDSINKLCIFYGSSNNWLDVPTYECGQKSVEAIYHYVGDIQVIAMNSALTYEKYTIENVSFRKSDPSSFVKNDVIVDVDNYKIDLKSDLEALLLEACGQTVVCEGALIEDIKIKYGDLQPMPLFDLENPEESQAVLDYIEILNKYIRAKNGAINSQNIRIELIYEYNVGPTRQVVSTVYNVTDQLPNITDPLSTDDIQLEYKAFDVTSDEIKLLLYGDEFTATLTANGAIYSGKIISRFVSYEDRNGHVTSIDNASYEYIASQTAFGYYTLECRVKLLEDTTNHVVFDSNMYGKSFFIRVELKDSIIPTLTLLGEKEVSVKQFDVYKDAGAKCSDSSGCEVEITYYFNTEDNEVEEIDTDVVGEYIIKFVAVDGDGNVSFVERRVVYVTGVNALDTTSIIVIASVVGLFVLIVVFAIIMEVRKNKKMKNIA